MNSPRYYLVRCSLIGCEATSSGYLRCEEDDEVVIIHHKDGTHEIVIVKRGK